MADVGAGTSALGALWGKSAERAGGTVNLLISHLLDTAAVAERIWDGLLAPSTKETLDDVAGGPGRGRRFFAWLCAAHDCGKATPAFQFQWAPGAAAVRAAGLGWHERTVANTRLRWRHEVAGAYLLRRELREAKWAEQQMAWVWPLIAGHHGAFPDEGRTEPPRAGKGQLQGGADWARAQSALFERFTRELGFANLPDVQPAAVPTRATQLHLSGLIVMADWIASDETHFPGVGLLADVSMAHARERAAEAWEKLRLRGGWGRLSAPGPEAFRARFGHDPRPSQQLVMDAARQMERPGLLFVEAPTGEGKTKAALIAAEILAARFGADGVFVGMPTQATSDPMFGQVRAWLSALSPDGDLASRVALLHGKRMFNKEWRTLTEGKDGDPEAPFAGIDEYGFCEDDDEFGPAVAAFGGASAPPVSRGPAEWFLGSKRGLLCPFVVGTIDQLLFAATRTRHVMLRMAGLVGKVVVLDEVHAADVYMSQFLVEGLRWLGQAGVPVVLLSATLPPAQREALTAAYLAGAASREEFTADSLPQPTGYPAVTAAWMASDRSAPRYHVASCASWRPDISVALDVLPETIPAPRSDRAVLDEARRSADASVVTLLHEQLADGGRALVIRNTVDRAQSLYRAMRAEFGDEVILLHGRLAVGARADRTERCLRLLGAPSAEAVTRPSRLIVVATQLAEQSFDVDADLLVTDIAPIDLLLQRMGRLHRHDGRDRPPRLRRPRVFLTGVSGSTANERSDKATWTQSAAPRFLAASEGIYGRHLLLRTAAVIGRSLPSRSWRLPGSVPALVSGVYGDDDLLPPAWADDAAAARALWAETQRRRADNATSFLLTRRGDKEGRTLAGLHTVALPGNGRDTDLDAVVRDGDPGAEVILVIHDGTTYRTLSGRALSVNGDVAEDLLDDVLAGTVRLPGGTASEAAGALGPLPGWLGYPRLRYTPALVLDARAEGVLGEHRARYDHELGLAITYAPGQRR
ncbi:CRISPR-associated helicase Cas3' [Streptomyces sp. NPDC048202]|uniref:CRISPR-associated helicase Cas3' n=1 Tax=Streptomyces sp. NPDC048202 TaxID=3365514 RepID=UPI0037217268